MCLGREIRSGAEKELAHSILSRLSTRSSCGSGAAAAWALRAVHSGPLIATAAPQHRAESGAVARNKIDFAVRGTDRMQSR